ncbi:hypothetical protein [Daejeonella sp.]|uniref:hypothetical protein n=1 Tax=Daejeonella sp. TaxID=2805397 RepID=UPI003983156F
MKLSLIYRITLGAVLSVILPLTLLASSSLSINIDKPLRREWESAVLPIYQDTTAARKKPSNKPQEIEKPSQQDLEERLKEAQKRAIKEVPRSIPKLKPKPVTDRIKIQRPPIKGRRN